MLARAEQDPLLRILTLIFGFVLIRDAMTPLGFWRLGATGGVPWLRFTDQAGNLAEEVLFRGFLPPECRGPFTYG
ncbi:hypothetical protein [Nonomuraea sp. B5E05]|uniref:hypothetical protein n=1 Tax=Nonomuraea sp. B5E05 TaxID=3153569 RepID=UPI003261712E